MRVQYDTDRLVDCLEASVAALIRKPHVIARLSWERLSKRPSFRYHVLHARTAYEDDREAGLVRHLKRLWLATDVSQDRPPYFQRNLSSHWEKAKSVSRLDVG
jgi:hypothetical protein